METPRFIPSRGLPDWLNEQRISLSFSTYEIGKVFLVGNDGVGNISLFERTLDRCMGLAADGESLYVGTKWQIWRFVNAISDNQAHSGYDRVYVPQVGYVTGDVDAHDIGVGSDGRIFFANTLFSMISEVSDQYSFKPVWKPEFISKMAPEDRCHLNGLAMKDGRPAYVSLVGRSDVADGWRDHRKSGGRVFSIEHDQEVLNGMSMPHSPRWYRDRLWLHNSGTGEFGFLDERSGRFEPICFCPGYLRGLSFSGDHAIVGLSEPREVASFSGLQLDENLSKRGATARCGLSVINIKNGNVDHWLRIEGIIREIYDVVVLEGTTRPMMIGFRNDEIERVLSIAPR